MAGGDGYQVVVGGDGGGDGSGKGGVDDGGGGGSDGGGAAAIVSMFPAASTHSHGAAGITSRCPTPLRDARSANRESLGKLRDARVLCEPPPRFFFCLRLTSFLPLQVLHLILEGKNYSSYTHLVVRARFPAGLDVLVALPSARVF